MIRPDVYFHSLKREQFGRDFGLVVEFTRLVYDKYVISLHADESSGFWIIVTYHPGLRVCDLFWFLSNRRDVFVHIVPIKFSDKGIGFFELRDIRVVSGFMPDKAEQVRVFCQGKAMNVLIYERVYIGILTRKDSFNILFFDSEGRLLEKSTRSMRLPSPFKRIIDGLLDKLRRTPRGQYSYGPSRRSQR